MQSESENMDCEDSGGGQGNGRSSKDAQSIHPPRRARPTMSPEDMVKLYQNCIKLASENKISLKNTWDLRLIDHLSDLVKPSAEEGRSTTNFQRASCTLEAGIKIYSYRVDSVHNETFKVLSGLNYSGGGRPQEAADSAAEEGEEDSTGTGDGSNRRGGGSGGTSDPGATLESSTDAINVKKFDLAFAVDPLFHKTSAQFDAGGASGLLLNNLSVYNGCEIIFDSAEVPKGALERENVPPTKDVQVDLGLLPPQVLLQARQPPRDAAIAPALNDMLRLLGQLPPPDAASDAARLVADILSDAAYDGPSAGGEERDASPEGFGSDVECDHGAPGDGGFDDFDDGNGVDDSWDASGAGPGSEPPCGSFAAAASKGGDGSGLAAESLQWLMDASHVSNDRDDVISSGPVTRGASWAGAAHWKYKAAPPPTDEAETKPKAPARKKKAATTLDFENLPPLPEGALAVAARPSRTRLTKLTRKDTLLPVDLHYEAARLSRLFLRPSVRLTRAAAARATGRSISAPVYDDDSYGGFDDDDGGGGDFDGGGDDEGPALEQGQDGVLIVEPLVVPQSIAYALTATQVDVKALKHALWTSIQNARALQGGQPQPLPFGKLMADVSGVTLPGAAAARETYPGAVAGGVSVHLCFICLLHLANEHSLALADSADLSNLTVMLPA